MSNTAEEVLADMLLAYMRWEYGPKKSGVIDKHRTDDKAWVAATLKSNETFIITVEKVRS